MSNKLYEENDIQNIANAIRNKNGTEDTYKVSQMSTAIDSIEVIEQATAEGESLSLTNTKAMPYKDYVVEGKSEQDGEPSPSNPSEIHSVADDVNLFDVGIKADYRGYSDENVITQGNYSWFNVEDKKLKYLVQDYGTTLIYNKTQYKGNETYNLQYVASSIYSRMLIKLRNSSNTGWLSNNDVSITGWSYVSAYNGWFKEFSEITTITEIVNIPNCLYCVFGFGYASKTSTTGTNQTISKIKIAKGSDIDIYTDYGVGTVTIKQRGKNKNDGINYGFYIGAEATTYRISTGDNGICIPIRNQNYTISTKEVQARYRVACSNSLPSDTSQNCFNGVVKDGTSNNVTINTSGYKYLLVNCTNINDIQIEQGLIATPYEPYQANDYTFQTEPLRSLPNGVKDTIEADGIHRRVGRVILDGSENWELWSGGTNTIGFKLSNITNLKSIQSSSTENIVLSNYFKKKTNQDRLTGEDEEGFATAVGNLYFKINRTTVNSLAEWKTWLSTHNTEIIYELETEIIEPLTQNQATTMLDIIKTGSYEGTTNIYTDEDVKPTIEVDYYKKS